MPALTTTPELVVFDIDGTLQDSFLWWPQVIRAGVRDFAAATGLRLDVPSDEMACSVVGMKDEGVWAPFLPPAEQHRWRELRALVLPMEVAVMHSGSSFLFPGVRELLLHLRALGVRTALASNCRSTYLQAVLEGQELGALTDWHFCLDSPGVTTKSDMLAAAFTAAGTKAAVMVGDREPDHLAAREHGVPFVWRQNPRCRIEDADAVWSGDPDELLAWLRVPPLSAGQAARQYPGARP